METTRRTLLKTWVALLMPVPEWTISSLPISVIGRWGFPWQDFSLSVGWGFEETLAMFRGTLETDPPSDRERRDVLKILLREFVKEREIHGSDYPGQVWLEKDKKRIDQIRNNSTPDLIEDIMQDPDFLYHFNHPDFVEDLLNLGKSLDPRKIDRWLEDIQKLVRMSQEDLESEYAQREAKRLKTNISNITHNLLGVTVGPNGYELTCRVKRITESTTITVRDMVWETPFSWSSLDGQTLSPWHYRIWNSLKQQKGRIWISGGKIASICIINTAGKSYEYPKDHGKEWQVIED